MKRNLCNRVIIWAVYALLPFVMMSCNEVEVVKPNEFVLKGTIEGLNSPYMLYYYKQDNIWKADTIKVEDASFYYKKEIDEMTYMKINPKMESVVVSVEGGGYIPAMSSYINFFAIPGHVTEVNGHIKDFVAAYPYGNSENEDLAMLHKVLVPLSNEAARLRAGMNSEPNEESQDKYEELMHQITDVKRHFIRGNPASVVSAYYLMDMITRRELKEEKAIELYDLIKEEQPESPFFEKLSQRIAGARAIKVNNELPEIEAVNVLENTKFSSSDLKGKYLLIDFWGTWCGPCVAEMPKIKEYYLKYEDKLEIVGVNNGDNISRILDYTSSKEYTWPQLMDKQEDFVYTSKFNVVGFPTKILVDPEGKIIYKKTGGGEEIFEMLDELLN
ncbi:Thiol-disulfide isomerase or thioredoxin [Zhouia amylolytica]|uniref:Thiol-disulfide isomerase or thioredoxin n=1 Tax=Zhouia amylolytica TaxID=376730 RepID=A0A1I6RTM0_9FLAO|nr:TlpA disulfide reductase family protein [Zhouia amylolytica]SFS68022.1 Thiol-disulfide isomerase or thioredoxin [Zhouia amylolytica]